MSKLILISGENNSGKSLFAEQLLAKSELKRFYIATMRPVTDDNFRRIEKHRAQRSGLGFKTLECPCEIKNAPVENGCAVLLEDVSNLLANSLFEKEEDEETVFANIISLRDRCGLLAAVTISDLSTEGCDEQTKWYVDSLNRLNRKLFAAADTVIFMKNSLPVFQKGEADDII